MGPLDRPRDGLCSGRAGGPSVVSVRPGGEVKVSADQLGDVLDFSDRREVTPYRPPTAPRTARGDRWWALPVVTVVVLLGFVVYGTWVAFQNANYYADPYVSPFYSPCLATSCLHPTASFLGSWWKWSPALLVLPFPLFFRLTCYYYLNAYYLPFPVFLSWDAAQSFFFPGGCGMRLGTLVLLVNVFLFWLYTLSCHSCRHLVGGRVDQFSKAPVRHFLWRRVSWLNVHHARWAWASLFSVAMADLYVRLVATGTIHDPRLF